MSFPINLKYPFFRNIRDCNYLCSTLSQECVLFELRGDHQTSYKKWMNLHNFISGSINAFKKAFPQKFAEAKQDLPSHEFEVLQSILRMDRQASSRAHYCFENVINHRLQATNNLNSNTDNSGSNIRLAAALPNSSFPSNSSSAVTSPEASITTFTRNTNGPNFSINNTKSTLGNPNNYGASNGHNYNNKVQQQNQCQHQLSQELVSTQSSVPSQAVDGSYISSPPSTFNLNSINYGQRKYKSKFNKNEAEINRIQEHGGGSFSERPFKTDEHEYQYQSRKQRQQSATSHSTTNSHYNSRSNPDIDAENCQLDLESASPLSDTNPLKGRYDVSPIHSEIMSIAPDSKSQENLLAANGAFTNQQHQNITQKAIKSSKRHNKHPHNDDGQKNSDGNTATSKKGFNDEASSGTLRKKWIPKNLFSSTAKIVAAPVVDETVIVENEVIEADDPLSANFSPKLAPSFARDFPQRQGLSQTKSGQALALFRDNSHTEVADISYAKNNPTVMYPEVANHKLAKSTSDSQLWSTMHQKVTSTKKLNSSDGQDGITRDSVISFLSSRHYSISDIEDEFDIARALESNIDSTKQTNNLPLRPTASRNDNSRRNNKDKATNQNAQKMLNTNNKNGQITQTKQRVVEQQVKNLLGEMKPEQDAATMSTDLETLTTPTREAYNFEKYGQGPGMMLGEMLTVPGSARSGYTYASSKYSDDGYKSASEINTAEANLKEDQAEEKHAQDNKFASHGDSANIGENINEAAEFTEGLAGNKDFAECEETLALSQLVANEIMKQLSSTETKASEKIIGPVDTDIPIKQSKAQTNGFAASHGASGSSISSSKSGNIAQNGNEITFTPPPLKNSDVDSDLSSKSNYTLDVKYEGEIHHIEAIPPIFGSEPNSQDKYYNKPCPGGYFTDHQRQNSSPLQHSIKNEYRGASSSPLHHKAGISKRSSNSYDNHGQYIYNGSPSANRYNVANNNTINQGQSLNNYNNNGPDHLSVKAPVPSPVFNRNNSNAKQRVGMNKTSGNRRNIEKQQKIEKLKATIDIAGIRRQAQNKTILQPGQQQVPEQVPQQKQHQRAPNRPTQMRLIYGDSRQEDSKTYNGFASHKETVLIRQKSMTKSPNTATTRGFPSPDSSYTLTARTTSPAVSYFKGQTSSFRAATPEKAHHEPNGKQKEQNRNRSNTTNGNTRAECDQGASRKKLVKERIENVLSRCSRSSFGNTGVDIKSCRAILSVALHGDIKTTWDDIAGLSPVKKALKEELVYPFLRPDLFNGLSEPTKAVLLYGPTGNGKTMLAKAIAKESKCIPLMVDAAQLVFPDAPRESEKLIKTLFYLARELSPVIIVIDSVEAIYEKNNDNYNKIKAAFAREWKNLVFAESQSANRGGGLYGDDNDDAGGGYVEHNRDKVLLIATTDKPWCIDEASRPLFSLKQYIALPDFDTRRAVLKKLTQGIQKHSLSEIEFRILSTMTNGCASSDIAKLVKEAAMRPLRELGDDLIRVAKCEVRAVNMGDFKSALKGLEKNVNLGEVQRFENWAPQYVKR